MIETRRLILRRWTASDLPSLDAILGSPSVMEFSDRGALGFDEQADWLEKALAYHDQLTLPGPLAIERRTDSRVIGYVSLTNVPGRVGRSEAELGFRLAEFAWDQGYATEAVAGLIKSQALIASIKRFVAIVDPHNQRSIRVLEKIGMSYERDVIFEGYDYPDHLYVRNVAV